jgi:CRISPR-associated protein Cas5d
MWARPDTGGAPTSYPAPTWLAAKGLLESIAFLSSGEAWLHPTNVAICRRCGTVGGEVRYQRYTTNYGGPLRKDLNVKGGTGMQLFATVIADVCYRIHAEVRGQRGLAGQNPRHHLQEMFERRLRKAAVSALQHWAGASSPATTGARSAMNSR